MRQIIRCPSCFTYVYQDARACHGCGERLGRRKILRAGSWIFIGLAVSVFAIARGIDLQQDARWRAQREREREVQHDVTRSFLRSWLCAEPELAGVYMTDQPFKADLAKLRDRYPNVLPACDVVGDLRLTDADEGHDHYQVERKSGISHTRWTPDASRVRRASTIPQGTSVGTYKWFNQGVKETYRWWKGDSVEFEAELNKDGAHYTVFGEVCLHDDKVTCLTIDKIEGLEGVVSPKE